MKVLTTITACAIVAVSCAQTTITINSGKDTSIYSNNLSAADGGGSRIVTGKNGVGGLMRSLVWFDVAAFVPTGATITNVQLTLTTAGLGANGTTTPTAATISARRLLQDWGEGTTLPTNGGGGPADGGPAQTGDATWSQNFYNISNWTTAGGTMSGVSATASSPASIGSAVSWSSSQLIADVQSMLTAPSQNYGWGLVSSTEGGGNAQAQAFWSKESGTAPTLRVTYTPVPEPATFAALGLGLLAMKRRLRRRA